MTGVQTCALPISPDDANELLESRRKAFLRYSSVSVDSTDLSVAGARRAPTESIPEERPASPFLDFEHDINAHSMKQTATHLIDL